MSEGIGPMLHGIGDPNPAPAASLRGRHQVAVPAPQRQPPTAVRQWRDVSCTSRGSEGACQWSHSPATSPAGRCSTLMTSSRPWVLSSSPLSGHVPSRSITSREPSVGAVTSIVAFTRSAPTSVTAWPGYDRPSPMEIFHRSRCSRSTRLTSCQTVTIGSPWRDTSESNTSTLQ